MLKDRSCAITGNSEAKKFTCTKKHKMCDTLQNCSVSSAVVCSDADKGIFSGTDQLSSKTSVESCLTELITAPSDYVDDTVVACDVNDESQYIVIEDSDTAEEEIFFVFITTRCTNQHYSTKHVLVITCHLSLCPSIYDVGGSGLHRLKILETNCVNN